MSTSFPSILNKAFKRAVGLVSARLTLGLPSDHIGRWQQSCLIETSGA